MRTQLLVLFVVLAILAALFAVFVNVTDIDASLRQALKEVVPQGLKAAVRPFRAPMVLSVSPQPNAADVSLRAPIAITFLTPMNPASTESNVSIEPKMAGQFSWQGNTLTFIPSQDWPLGTQITVAVSREARSWLLRRMEQGFTFKFTTLGPPTIVKTEPAQGAKYTYLRNRLAITFNRAMDKKSVESRLLVTPQLYNQRLAWQENTLLISGAMKPSTEYKIALLSGAQDTAYGLTTQDDFVWTFTTTERYPYLAIVGVGRFGLVEAEKPAQLQLNVTNVSKIDLNLYQVDVPTYVKMQGFSWDDWRMYKPKEKPLRTWSIEPKLTLDEESPVPLDLGTLPAGIYYLIAKSPEEVQDSQVLVASHIAMTLKHTATEALVWATEISGGTPIANLNLSFYDEKSNLLTTGQTDKDGMFYGSIPATKGTVHVIAQREKDLGVVADEWQDGIEPWRFEGVLWQWETKPHNYRVFLYTDRPIYRPGQHLYFKGIVRRDDDGRYSQPPSDTAVKVTVTNWQDNVIYQKTLKTTSFGSISDDFTLNPEMPLGEYVIKAQLDDEEYQSTFRVESYRKPEYAVTVKLDKDSYVNGDTITATVNAAYYFGAPAANTKVRYTLYSNDYWFYWSGGEFDFGNLTEQRYYGLGKEIANGTGTTDAQGNLTITLKADISQEERSQVYTIEATVTDPANQPVSGFASTVIHRGTFYIGLQPESYVVSQGKDAAFAVQTVGLDGKTRGNIALDYTAYRIDWRSYRDDKGYWKWEEIKSEVATGEITTDADGKGRIVFTPPRGGAYRLDVTGQDERGNRVLSTSWLWVSSREEVSWRFENNDRIQLTPDKRHYKPGETAQVLVQSPYKESTALVTIERGRIISHRQVELASNSATISVPIDKDYFPNVYVSAVLIPKGGFADGRPSFKVGYTELRVEAEEHKLNVAVSADKKRYGPHDSIAYTIQTADYQGKPVSAEVSLGVVDKAIYALLGTTPPSIEEAFYGRKELAVRTAQSLAVHIARISLRKDYGGGGGEEGGIRKLFPDVAYWNPTIVTDAQGQAQVEFVLPDNLTTWAARAVGATAATQVGSGEAESLVTKELIVRPVLPRFFNAGDQATIGTVVHNYTGAPVEADVSIAATGLTLSDAASQHVIIADGQTTRVNWNVTVGQATTAKVTMKAVTPKASDGVELSMPILPFGEKKIVSGAGEVTDTTTFTLKVPSDATYTSLTIDGSPSLAAGLVSGLEYLTGYPYGCVEQTMSRFLPDVLVAQTLKKLQLRNEALEAEIPKQVEDGLMRLYRFQHWDGGWGWWESDDTRAYETAYVVYGLIEAKRAGFNVDEKVIQKGIEALKTALPETEDLDQKTYVLYVLTQHGDGDLAMARSLRDRQGQMSLYARAYLALTFDLLGMKDEGKAIVADLEKKALTSDGTARWEEAQTDWETMSSNGRTTALILQAMVALDPESPLVSKTVRWLMQRREGGYWRTTQETAATIIALTNYLAVTKELEANYKYQVYLDGQLLGEETVTPDRATLHRQFKLTNLKPGDHVVKLVKQIGQGRLYFSSSLQYYQTRESLSATKSLDGPIVHRDYLNPDTNEPITSFKVGDLIRVKLTVEAPRDLWYVVIEDPLPAGTEAINGTLNTATLRGQQAEYFWSYPDLRDEKAVFFSTFLWKGTNTYTYLIQALTSGSFRAMPAEAYAMYEPDLWGRSASAAFKIAQ